jgi:hypothetical protein
MRWSPKRGAVRRAVLVPFVLIASLVLAGCFTITNQSTSQLDVVGDLVITTEMCTPNPIGSGGCAAGLDQDSNADNQFFVAHLVSDWATAPATISWTGTLGNLTLTSSPEFAAALGAKLTAGPGQKWIAYASTRQPKLTAHTDYRMTASTRIGVPAGSPSTIALATVTGWRIVRDADAGAGITGLPIDRPISCDEPDPDDTNKPAASCAVSALPGTQPDSPTNPANTQSVELSTLSLTAPGSPVTVTAGATATITFDVAAHRAAGAVATVPAAATTTLSGATPTTGATIALEGQSTAAVQVPVPANATPGDYDVVLSGANGTRTATATLRVNAAPTATPTATPAPTATPEPTATPAATATPTAAPAATPVPTTAPAALAGPQLRTLQQFVDELAALLKVQTQVDGMRRGNTFDLPLGAPSAGTLKVSLERTVRIRGKKRVQVLARGTRVLTAPGAAKLKLVPTKLGARLLNAGKPHSGTLRVQLKTSAGVQKAKSVRVKFG